MVFVKFVGILLLGDVVLLAASEALEVLGQFDMPGLVLFVIGFIWGAVANMLVKL